MLIINTSNKVDIQELGIDPKAEATMLDLTGQLSADFPKIDVGAFGELDEIYGHAQRLYADFMEQLIQVKVDDKPISDYRIHELSVFWMTASAVKHPITHWNRNFFVLLSILKYGRNFINDQFGKIHVIIRPEVQLFQPELARLIEDMGINIAIEVHVSRYLVKPQSLKHLLKSFLIHTKKMFAFKPEQYSSGKEPDQQVFLVHNLTNTHAYQNQFLPVKKLFNKKGQEITFFPFIEWEAPSFMETDFPQSYARLKPGFLELLQLNSTLLSLFQKIKKARISDMLVDGIGYSSEFIRDELINVLTLNTQQLYSYHWLRKYVKQLDSPLNIFFEDEFYSTGKIVIASAASNALVKTFGIQHGHFNEAHTVYTLTDLERMPEYNNPLPDAFIVWGNYYKQVFGLPSTLNKPEVLSLGSPRYIHALPKTTEVGNHKVLWCLTSKECFKLEWEIIKSCDQMRDFELTIRLHPVPHVSEEDVQELLGDFPYSMSREKNIEESMGKASIIMMSAHSTVFLDAILQKRPSIRLITNRWIGSSRFQNNQLFDVRSSMELSSILKRVKVPTKSEQSEIAFLELEEEKWLDFIARNNKHISAPSSS